MVIHIYSDNVETAWPLMVTGLSRALTKTSLGRFWDLPSALQGVKSGELFGFHQPESGYSGIYSINQTPLANVLYFFWSGKDDELGPIDFSEINDYLETVARAFSCSYINCEGRKGWKSVLLPMGYQEDSLFYSREVSL